MADLVHWADVIDGALYPDARTAVEMKAPAMKLTMVIESATKIQHLRPELIPFLATIAGRRSWRNLLLQRLCRRCLNVTNVRSPFCGNARN